MLKMPDIDKDVMARRVEIVTALREIVPGEGVITEETERRVYETDGLTAYISNPRSLSYPRRRNRSARSCGIATKTRFELCRAVPGRLSGGALPLEDGVLLGLGKFNRVLEVDYDNRCAIMQPGVTNLGVTKAVKKKVSIMHPILRRKSPAPLGATSRRIRAVCTA